MFNSLKHTSKTSVREIWCWNDSCWEISVQSYSTIPAKSLGTPSKNTRIIRNLWKTPCVSLLPCLYDTVLVTALPLPLPSNVESACNNSGCEGRFTSTSHSGWSGMREFAGVLRQDCRWISRLDWNPRVAIWFYSCSNERFTFTRYCLLFCTWYFKKFWVCKKPPRVTIPMNAIRRSQGWSEF